MQLQYNDKMVIPPSIEARLQELSLAYKKHQEEGINEVTLIDGDQLYQGEAAIQKHLDRVQSELGQWYYCDC